MIAAFSQATTLAATLRLGGGPLVFTNGCFDLLHLGHIRYLQNAANEGRYLIVGLNSDTSVRLLQKGEDRPLFDQNYRAEMLAALNCVKAVIVFDQPTPLELIQAIRPDVLVKGPDYTIDNVVGAEFVQQTGGRVKILPGIPGLSTTAVLRRLRRGVDMKSV